MPGRALAEILLQINPTMRFLALIIVVAIIYFLATRQLGPKRASDNAEVLEAAEATVQTAGKQVPPPPPQRPTAGTTPATGTTTIRRSLDAAKAAVRTNDARVKPNDE